MTDGHDRLASVSGERYAERLREAGVAVRHARIDGMVHHFPGQQALMTFFGLLKDLLAEVRAT